MLIPNTNWRVFAFDTSTNIPVTDDEANITAELSIQYGVRQALADVNPINQGDGYYLFSLSNAERTGLFFELYPESSTPNVQVLPLPPSITNVVQTLAGGGSETFVQQFLAPGDLPIAGVAAYVTSDAIGGVRETTTLFSNQLGEIAFSLNPGTFYIWASHSGHTFPQPIEVTIEDV